MFANIESSQSISVSTDITDLLRNETETRINPIFITFYAYKVRGNLTNTPIIEI